MRKTSHVMDQIAYASRSEEDTLLIKKTLGLEDAEWVTDIVEAEGVVYGRKAKNTAKLLFCYEFGMEIEILQYLEGDNYLEGPGGRGYDGDLPFYVESGHVAHLGVHAADDVEPPVFPFDIVQQVTTVTHTNPFLVRTGRHYRYTIYNTKVELGHYTKVIERIRGEYEL